MEKKGTTPYVTHFIFRPLMSIDIPGLGTATLLEALGTTQNMKGEKMLDKMSARCTALSVDSGPKKYIDGACILADADGDKIFSTFDTRDVDKPKAWLNEVGVQKLGYYADPSARTFQDLKAIGRAFGMPTTLLVDPQGCEIATIAGPAEWASDDAIKLIKAALGP